MLKKRIIGVVTVLNGWAVQSIGYRKYLPLGRPNIIAENLDRWGVDEIMIISIDRTINKLGPDKETLDSLNNKSLSTPISYGGGIRTLREALFVINNGAERLLLDSIIEKNSINEILKISEKLGSQSLIASLPLKVNNDKIHFINYKNIHKYKDERMILDLLNNSIFSEALIIDLENEGIPQSFNKELIKKFNISIPTIAFGGISDSHQASDILKDKKVSAVAIGNFLNYKEHSVQKIKDNIKLNFLRKSKYKKVLSRYKGS